MKIAAIDCADMKNDPVCREHHVAAYPTLIVSSDILILIAVLILIL